MDPKKKERASHVLRELYPSMSARLAEECFEAGWVTDPSGLTLKKGDRVEAVAPIDDRLALVHRGNPELVVSVIAERPDYVVVDKPAGVPGHPNHLEERSTITHWAFEKYPATMTEFPEIQPTLTPHRLDTDTSGVLIVALTKKAFAKWRERFHGKEIRKRYLAWCHGETVEDEWTVDQPIGKADAKRRCVDPKSPYEAITVFRVLKREKGMFLVEASCRTGVTHQVRVHAAHSGHPLVGDGLYGSDVAGPHRLRACRLEGGKEVFEADVAAFSESAL